MATPTWPLVCPFETVGTAVDAGAVNVLFGSASGLTADLPDDQRGPAPPTHSWPADFAPTLASAAVSPQVTSTATASSIWPSGAPRDSPHFVVSQVGAVNVIHGSTSGLSATIVPDQLLLQSWFNSDGPEASDAFGFAVAAGDFNGDTFDDLAVGVPHEDLGVFPGQVLNAGAVNVFHGSANGLQTERGTTQSWDQDIPGVEGGVEPDDEFGVELDRWRLQRRWVR